MAYGSTTGSLRVSPPRRRTNLFPSLAAIGLVTLLSAPVGAAAPSSGKVNLHEPRLPAVQGNALTNPSLPEVDSREGVAPGILSPATGAQRISTATWSDRLRAPQSTTSDVSLLRLDMDQMTGRVMPAVQWSAVVWPTANGDIVRVGFRGPATTASQAERPRARSTLATAAPPSLVNPAALSVRRTSSEQDLPGPPEEVLPKLPYEDPLPNHTPLGPPITAPGPTRTPQRLGVEPDDTSLLFLRQATVLLSPGQAQVDYGLVYSWQDQFFPVELSNFDLANDRVRRRQLVVPLALRYGITERLQMYADVPFGYGQFELSNPDQELNDETFGLGDVGAGLNYLLRRGEGGCSDLVGSIGFTAPTGEDAFGLDLNNSDLGTGFWTVSADLLWIQEYDPVVLFGGIGYRHFFGRTFLGGRYQPGEEFNYVFGLGFAVNDSITLSTAFRGAYEGTVQFNRHDLPGSELEPFTLRVAATTTPLGCCIVEPFVNFGLNEDAADAEFGIIWTRTF